MNIPNNIALSSKEQISWWNSNYAFRKKINAIKQGKNFFEFNHAELVIAGKSNDEGSDIVIVEVKNSNQNPILYDYKNFNQISTLVEFSAVNDAQYFMYYGNKVPKDITGLKAETTEFKSNRVDLLEEVKPMVSLFSKKKWALKYATEANVNANISISNLINSKDSTYFYVLNDQPNSIKQIKINSDFFSFDVSNLNTGEHSIKIIVENGSEKYVSNSIKFILSEPMFVAWTIDWEGVDPKNENMGMMSDIANQFNIPMTHFFNPRILMFEQITLARRKEIVNWVLNRKKNNNDEIAMHMHMQHDMVEAAGVRPKENNKGWNNDVRGYDIPSSDYSYEDYLKLLKWAQGKFTEYGLPKPTGYRTGGWFAEEHTLKAIEDAGFAYDSSARKPFELGTEKFVQSWTLDNTAQPYRPDYNDQNNMNGNNKMKLLEVPNNGTDSYWSDEISLVNNFYLNYTPGEILQKDKIVVYLSHPEWFSIDNPKLKNLFAEISKFKFDADKGPVIFVTIQDYLQKSNYIKTLK